MKLPEFKAGLQLSIRCAASAGLAVGLAHLLQLQYPIYALVGAVIVTDLSPVQTRTLGVQRLIGTVLGAVVGVVMIMLLPHNDWTIGFSILGAMLLSFLVGLKGAAKISGYVCGIIVLDHHDHPWMYALHRLIETVLGISVAILVSLVPKLLPADADKSGMTQGTGGRGG